MNQKLARKVSYNPVVNGEVPVPQKEDMQCQQSAEETAEPLP